MQPGHGPGSVIEELSQGDSDEPITDRLSDRLERLGHFGPHEARRRGRVVNWTQVSASQVVEYKKCKRLWYNNSVLRLPRRQTGSQGLGEAVHLANEMGHQGRPFDKSDVPGCPPEDWDLALGLSREILRIMPRKIDGYEVGFSMDTYDGGPIFKGYIDVVIHPGHPGWPELMIPADEAKIVLSDMASIGRRSAIIVDYKTTSAWRYMKTPAELADDIQMMSYAKWAITPPSVVAWDEPPPDTVWLAHIYANTKNKVGNASVRHSEVEVTHPQILTKWDEILTTIREMQNTACITDANDVEGTGALTGHCQAYGGCHYREQCGIGATISSTDALKNLFKTQANSENNQVSAPTGNSALMARIAAARSGTVVPAATQAPVATATPAPTPAPAPVAPSAPAASPAKPGGLSAMLSARPATPPQTGIVPPDAPPRDQPVITQPGQAVAQEIPEEGDEGEGEDSAPAPTTLNMTTTPTAGAPIVVSSAPRRGRPTKEEAAAKKAAEEQALNAEIERRVAERLANSGGDAAAYSKLKAEYDSLVTTTTALRDARDEAFSKVSDLTNRVNELAKDRDYFQGLADAAAKAASATPATGLSEAEMAEIEATIASLTSERDAAIARAHQIQTAAVQAGPSAAPEEKGTTLYLGCYPAKGAPEGSVVDFDAWIQPVLDVIAQANNVADWRLIDYKARGILAVALREVIAAEGLPAKMTIDLNHSAAPTALEILKPLARKIVRAY